MNDTTALLVGTGSRRRALTSNLDSLGIRLVFAENWRRARNVLQERPEITVVVTDLTLPDGNWCDAVHHAAQRDFQVAVVVVSRTGTERLWAELLWRGAHDLLVEPFSEGEIRRAVEGAARAAEAARQRSVVRVAAPPSGIALPAAIAAS